VEVNALQKAFQPPLALYQAFRRFAMDIGCMACLFIKKN
jgi:hypothetical protein